MEHARRWLRRLDALAAAGLVWVLLAVLLPGVGAGAQAGAAGVIAALLGAVAPIRVRWRPVSAPVGLWVSRMVAPGDRAWYVRRRGPDLVMVTGRRGLRLTVAVPGRGAAEGVRSVAADPRARPRRRRAAAPRAAALIRLRPRSA